MKTIFCSALTFLFISFLCLACSKDDRNRIPGQMPECIRERISQSLNHNESAITAVYSYQYHGAPVYYITPDQCNDCFSELLDENCNLVCYPDGGFSGGGDGRCTDFFQDRSGERLIWTKP